MKYIYYFIFCFIITACSLAPPYQRPAMNIPADYKESGKWIKSGLSVNPPGPWWEIYGNQQLNELENKVTISNQDLKAALARLEEARAAAAVARSAYYPTVTGVGDGQRIKTSADIANQLTTPVYNDALLGTSLSYEIDVFGKVRNSVAAANSLAKASEFDLAAMELSLHAELASDYFILQGDDESQKILDETVAAYKKALYLTRMRHRDGAAPEADVDQAATQLATAETLDADNRLKRAELEHAIAVLTGEPPANFALSTQNQKIKVISITPDLPSYLLERRPDIARQEQFVEAANSEIGVARAAYFPDFSLLGTLGVESQMLSNLISAPSLFWSLGPSATMVLFDGGKISAQLAEAKASYYETVANYRQSVLIALREVEDSLVSIHRLNQEIHSQAEAVHFADRALIQAEYRYRGGIITYLDVVVTQNTALEAELADVDVRTRRQVASVQLVKALGGSW